MRKNKHGNKKTVVDGITFASKHEAKRYGELKLLLRVGIISDLELQKKYVLIPAQYREAPTGEVYKVGARKGLPKIKRVCIEESCCYVADFVYKKDGREVVEDAKGVRTKDYIIKRKLMLYVHGIRIVEV